MEYTKTELWEFFIEDIYSRIANGQKLTLLQIAIAWRNFIESI